MRDLGDWTSTVRRHRWLGPAHARIPSASRTAIGVSAAVLVTVLALAAFVAPYLRPNGRIPAGQLPGSYQQQQVPTVDDSSVIERLQASDEPPASRDRPRPTPVPSPPGVPADPRPLGASPLSPAAAVSTTGGDSSGAGSGNMGGQPPMTVTTPCPPPLPPPAEPKARPTKSKKDKLDRVLTIFSSPPPAA